MRDLRAAAGQSEATSGLGPHRIESAVGSPSSSGLGHRPFKAAARVRTPLGTQDQTEPDQVKYLASLCATAAAAGAEGAGRERDCHPSAGRRSARTPRIYRRARLSAWWTKCPLTIGRWCWSVHTPDFAGEKPQDYVAATWTRCAPASAYPPQPSSCEAA
jgi:hypothetical protein